MLVVEFNGIFSLVIGVIHALNMCIAIFCAYGTVRLHGILASGFGIFGADILVMITIFVNTLANVNQGSRQFLRGIKKLATTATVGKERQGLRPRDSIIMLRELSTLHELRISIGSSFFYDKGIVLTTLQIIFQTSINFILMH